MSGRDRLRPVLDGADSRPVLLVAGPDNERGEPEVRAIAAMSLHSTVLCGDEAAPAATLAGMRRARMAHLAAHGHHEPDNPLFSALDLAGGQLTGYDLQGLDRAPAIVVLSSCDLGLSDVRPGDEALGMAVALLSVGTATVLASVTRRAASMIIATVMNLLHFRG